MAKISPFQAALPDLNDILSSNDFFGSAKRKFPLYLSDGMYIQQKKEALYIYRINREHRSHTGILSCTNVLDYINGEIKKHENTLAAKEKKMMQLFEDRQSLIKPLLLTYPNVLEIDALVNRITTTMPSSFTIDYQEEEHIFWKIEEPIQIENILTLFDMHISKTYICDGHHRAKTSEILYKKYQKSGELETNKAAFKYMLVAYFPASEIEVHNYNRIIDNLPNITDADFLKKMEQYYEIFPCEKGYTPLTQYEIGMLLSGQWYQLKLRNDYIPSQQLNTTEQLDVYLLNRYVLEGILKIKDIRNESNIRYLEGPKGILGLEEKVQEKKSRVAFNMYPVALEDLIKISDEEATLPPKSTWIEPRMQNGFVTYLYADIEEI